MRGMEGWLATAFFILGWGVSLAGDVLLAWASWGFALVYFICWLFNPPESKESVNEDSIV